MVMVQNWNFRRIFWSHRSLNLWGSQGVTRACLIQIEISELRCSLAQRSFKNVQNQSVQNGLCSLFLDLESSFSILQMSADLFTIMSCLYWTWRALDDVSDYQTSWWLAPGINLFLQISSMFHTVLITLLNDCNLWYQFWIVVPL